MELLASYSFTLDEFHIGFDRYRGSKPVDVLNVSTLCGWISAGTDGVLGLTESGSQLLERKFGAERLREQLHRLITTQRPGWLALTPRGRGESLPFLPSNVRQCIEEAGLNIGYDESTVSWWDSIRLIALGMQNEKNIKTGRLGEFLSMRFETDRIGVEPVWTAINSNQVGYDLRSFVDSTGETPLCIEVKASTATLDTAVFHVSRGEWAIAVSTNNYVFHLWLIHEWKTPAILLPQDVEPHIPFDRGAGSWEEVTIPYCRFSPPG